MELLSLALDRFGLFWLVAARIGGVVLVLPPFGHQAVAPALRFFLTLFLALAVLPVVPAPAGGVPGDLLGYAGLFVREVAVGLAIGFLVNLILAAAEAAGHLLDMGLGFGLVNVIDPVFGRPTPLTGQFLHFLALLVFLLADAHHQVLAALLVSFRQIPPGGGSLLRGLGVALDQAGWFFATALRLALPILAVLFLTNLVVGLVSRAAPQLNVFAVGFPAQVAVGLVALALAVPAYVLAFKLLLPELYRSLDGFLGVVAR